MGAPLQTAITPQPATTGPALAVGTEIRIGDLDWIGCARGNLAGECFVAMSITPRIRGAGAAKSEPECSQTEGTYPGSRPEWEESGRYGPVPSVPQAVQNSVQASWGCGLHHHRNDFLLRAGIQPGRTELTSDTARLETAPGEPRIDCAPAVDPHGAHAHSRRDGVRCIDIPRPHARREPVAGCVRKPHGFLCVIEGHHRPDRAENLLLGDAHVVAYVRENRRLEEITFAAAAVTACNYFCAFLYAKLHVALDTIELFLAHQGTHLCFGIERIALLDAIGGCAKTLEHLLVPRAVHEDSRASGADLPGIGEQTHRHASYRCVHCRIRQHNVRGFATKLERDALESLCCRPLDLAADLRTPREADFVDTRMAREGCASDLTQAGDDIEHTGRESCLLDQLRDVQSCERRLLGGLHHHRASRRKSWR